MTNCNIINELLVLYAENELSPEEARDVRKHLEACASCARELESITTVRGWLQDPLLFSPREDLSWQMLPEKMAARVAGKKRLRFFSGRALGWSVSIILLLALGLGLEWQIHRSDKAVPGTNLVSGPLQAPDNSEFIGRMQSVLAREATADYLSQCQDLLVNLMRAKKNCLNAQYDVSLEIEQARELLRRKRLLDAELQLPGLVHARDLCNDLESFLVNLSISEKCESPVGIQRMERMIEKEKLLLRINVIQSELS